MNAGQDTVVKWSDSFIYRGGGRAHEEHRRGPPGCREQTRPTRAQETGAALQGNRNSGTGAALHRKLGNRSSLESFDIVN